MTLKFKLAMSAGFLTVIGVLLMGKFIKVALLVVGLMILVHLFLRSVRRS